MQVDERAGEDQVRNKRPSAFSRRSEFALFIAMISLLVSAVARAVPNQGQTPEGARTAEAVRVDRAPKLDGTLDDPLWQMARPITDFRQREPNEGEPATEKTEVRILYTQTAVYFGIHCY